LGDQIVR